MKCPRCDTDNRPDSKYCRECATSLTGAEEAKPSFTKTLETPLDELTRGTLFADRYEMIEELGEGGMGAVYRVEDIKAREEIALKLIKPEIAADKKTIERFRNELTTARKIAHRNVCKMFDLGENQGVHFITMEYVKGEDLKSFLRRSGQLAIPKAISIAEQVCMGLAEAHRSGIVHRDLKPSNIMIDKQGNARIMDFGIARSLRAKGITGAGVVIGTPEYMSPEQAEAKEVDHRSDIYSLGVILYEMVSGHLPFEGSTSLSIAMKHKAETPINPRDLNPHVTESLSQLITTCLEKEKEKRWQDTKEVCSELERIKLGIPITEKDLAKKKPVTSREITVSFPLKKLFIPALVVAVVFIVFIVIKKLVFQKDSISPVAGIPSVAVLPFDDYSPEKDQEHLCYSIPEELIRRLALIEGIWVPARTSSFSFKGKDVDLREIGKKLNVENVLQASLSKDANELRINVGLVNVDESRTIWQERYDRDAGDVFDLMDEIALKIVENLKVILLDEEKAKLTRRYTEEVEAYQLYSKGMFYRYMWTVEGFKLATEYLKESLKTDPNFALAYVGLASVYTGRTFFDNIPPHEAYPQAKTHIKKALKLDPSLAEAHAILGHINTVYDWDWEKAEQELKQALVLNSNSVLAHIYYSHYLLFTGRPEAAIAEARQAKMLDPLNLSACRILGIMYFRNRQYDKAMEEFLGMISMFPPNYSLHWGLGWIYQAKSMMEKAIPELEKAVELSNRNHTQVFVLGHAYFEWGQRAKADMLFEELKQRSGKEYIPPIILFYIHHFYGEDDEALRMLERSCIERDSWLLWFVDVPIESLKILDDQRFNKIFEIYGLKGKD